MNNTLWVEKFRPTKIEDCILPEEIKTMFQSIVDSREIPNLLLTGSPGIGKTTVAKALCNQLDCDWLMINGSDEGRMIDTLRTTVVNYASTVSLSGGKKVIIIDEADYMNKDSVQPALRGVIEEFSKNCRFIFTCNFKNRIIPALHSRCSVVDFTINKDDKPHLGMEMLDNIKRILDEEGVKYDGRVLADLILKYFPDFRRVINELQKYSLNGIIDDGILKQSSDENFNELFISLKGKDFSGMRKWVAQNIDNDHVRLYRQIYDTLNNRFEKKSIPQAVLLIADYSYKSAFVADQEVNMVACLTELMMDCEFI
jgi:DNA polymerase III delta prime subunit|tara:strand:+ start:710 stop:1648 length:939 start_codon:yes stop_codon:yes gene_type:complete